MKAHSRLARLLALALLLSCGLCSIPGFDARAQTVPTGFQEYFVLGYEQHVWDMLTRVQTGEGGPAFANGMNSVVSATASADNQVVTYDHWEDGLEADVLNPVQATTLVIGDSNNANGRACDFTTDPRIAPCNGTNDDVLFAGSFVNFNSDQGLGCAAPPNDTQCSVPVNPRSAVDIRFDGGDLLVSSGGPLSLVHPQDPLSPFIGGATEIIPRQAVANATAYTIPIGEDIYTGDNTLTEPFKYVDLNLIAFDDNTQVNINSPGAGNVAFTLNRGQHYSSRGFIDGVAATGITVNAGTRIATTGPIAGLIFTGGDGTFATRFYSLLPDILHSTDYIITAPGDDPVLQGSRPLNLYIFNPDPLNSLAVTATDSVGTVVINVPPNASVDYFTGTGRFVPANSTVRMTSDRRFWGVSAYSHQSPANDWGHSWLSREFVTATYTIPFAPGVNNPGFQSQAAQRLANDANCTIPPAGPGVCDPLNRSPIFVSATVDSTRVQIDFDNDGIFDVIDLDGDDFPDAAPLPNNTYLINALQSLRVYDLNDYDNTGTLVVANKPVAVAYGQDTDQATGPDPIQDTGYAIYPINQLFLDPVLVLEKSVDTPVLPTAGGIATYTLTLSAFNSGPMTGVQIYDLLPPGVTTADYVPGSTLITYPNLSQSTTDPAFSIDPGSGRDRLDWGLLPNTLQTNQTITVRYSINIPAAPGGTPRSLTNEGHGEGSLGGSTFSPLDTAEVVQADLTLTKAVTDDGTPEAGEVLTYTLTLHHNGLVAETNVTVSDAIPPNTTFLPASITTTAPFVGAYNAGQNAIEWTTANLPPGGPYSLSFQVTVNPGLPAGTQIDNQAGYESSQTPLFPSNEVTTTLVGPNLVAAKTGPGLLHPNEIATFEITVDNIGNGTANNVRIVDLFPANATYLSESMTWRRNIAPFASVTDAADADEGTEFVDRLELLVATLGPGEEVTFRFQVQVDPGTVGLTVSNQATVTSTEVLPTFTNLVQAPIVGDAEITGHVFLDLDGNGVQNGGEPDLANIDVTVTDSTGAIQTVTTDANGDYIATVALACYADGFGSVAYNGNDGGLDWSATPWTEFTDQGDADQDPTTATMLVTTDPLAVFGNSLVIEDGPGSTPSKGFTRAADLSGAAGFTSGLATLSFNYRRESFEGGDVVTLDIDYDNDGTFNDVLATYPDPGGSDATWQSASLPLDSAQLPDNPVVFRFITTGGFSSGSDNFYVDNVRLCNTQATVNVDETDPDFPANVTLSTANDPQTLAVIAGGTVATTPVGYEPDPLTFSKTSDAPNGEVVPGQTVTYTLTAVNTSMTTQTGVSVSDPLPTGTSAVPGSTLVTLNSAVMRVTEYYLAPGTFSGTFHDLTLNQALATEYFVVAQGSDGDGSGNGNRGPDENYAALTQDPFGTGQLGTSAGADVLRFERGNAVNSWVGVVTVVECIADCATNGFNLLDVRRVAHTGAATSGNATSASTWSDINQVQLVGGFNGAGCDTSETNQNNTKVCHARLFPSGSDQINWTRDAGGATLSTATSTVMVVDWGSAWNVQRVRVQGGNGGDGADAVDEYNTAAISAVNRDQTWVWGTGHTNDNGIGDAAEAVLVTLGNGVNQNASETLVAAGIEVAGNAIDFEVWTLSHPDLAVDYRFKADGDSGSIVVDMPVDSATSQRMALVTNGQNGTGTAYPRPMFSARYLNDTTVRLERRRSGQNFPAWVQGIDFSAITGGSTVVGGDPANLVVLGDGYSLPPGASLTITFQVVVDDPLAGGISQIANTATLDTDQQPPLQASVTDDVVRLAVTVEPNNAGFTVAGGSVTYTHVVTNTGQDADAYDLTLTSELGYTVELIDPATGTVIATDSNGDGVWDGGVTINTGTLNPGESTEYRVRVNVPGGTAVGTQETTTLTATSDRANGPSAFATDETTIVDSPDVGPVILTPDQSGVVTAGGSIAYTHSVTNNTGAADTFDLTAFPTLPGWTATIYNDSNGDGVYSPGVDVAINNTLLLADGQLQTIFVVVDAPGGATADDVDVVHLTAISQTDPALFDAATDTTTLLPATTHDLSGGGTLLVDPGDTAIFPGTIKNLTDSADRFEFTVGASVFLGLDGLNHPTQLVIDTNADGTPDTVIATDSDGDGTWDSVDPAYDLDTDGNPDVAVAASTELAYEIRRAVDPLQPSYRDPVTLTATSVNSGETDSITATNLLAAATFAMLRHFEAYIAEGQVVLDWNTSFEHRTAGFRLLRTPAASAAHPAPEWRPVRHSLGQGLLPALESVTGGAYRIVDAAPTFGMAVAYLLQEIEIDGTLRTLGRLDVELDPATASSRPAPIGYERAANPPASPRLQTTSDAAPVLPDAGITVQRLRLRVADDGLHFLTATAIAEAFGSGFSVEDVQSWIARGWLRLHQGGISSPVPVPCVPPPVGDQILLDGFESGNLCAWQQDPEVLGAEGFAWLPVMDADSGEILGLDFFGQSLPDDHPDGHYTSHNVYWLEYGPGVRMATVAAGAPAANVNQSYVAQERFEEEFAPLTSVITDPDSDFWFWSAVNVTPAAGAGIDTMSVDLPTPGRIDTSANASLRVHLQAETSDADIALDHQVEVRLNGTAIGSSSWDGSTAHELNLTFAQNLLNDSANTLEIHTPAASGIASEIFYLDALDLAYQRTYQAQDDRLLAPANGTSLTAHGFSVDTLSVWDVTDAQQPIEVTNGVPQADGTGAYQVSFQTVPGHHYLVQSRATARVVPPEPDSPSDLQNATNRASYLVLAASGLETAADDLVAYRQGQGVEALRVRVQDIYDEFNGGRTSPWAIRNFLAHARATWAVAPTHVLLAGDSSFDFKDRLGFGGNLLPSPMTSTPEGLFPSDHRIADLTGNDGVPEVALGRVPARTNAELAAYVAKVQAFETANFNTWKRRSLWIADAVDEGGEFVDDSESLLGLVPQQLEIERIYVDTLGEAAARKQLLDQLNSGALLVNFLGHANLTQLGDSAGLLHSSDIASLSNAGRTPILSALTCALGRFDRVLFDTLSEQLVMAPNGGVVALWAPTGFAFNEDGVRLGEEFLPRVMGGEPLGDAVRAALAAYLAAGDARVHVPFTYGLLGDPLVVLTSGP